MRKSLFVVLTLTAAIVVGFGCSKGGGGGGGTTTPEPTPSGSVAEGAACTADAECVTGLVCSSGVCTKEQAASGTSDGDSDGLIDALDNCPEIANAEQADSDTDGKGDVCDDSDGDLVMDSTDNCVSASNNDQADLDKDGKGDACDDDIDGDNVANADDKFPTDPIEWADDDGDKVGNNADPDIDGDGILNEDEDDIDGDGKLNSEDNCPEVANKGQEDFDSDGSGDACDEDDDNDLVADGADNCDFVKNHNQDDVDADGVGDLCDPSGVWVSCIDGDDNNSGSYDKPLKTIANAVELMVKQNKTRLFLMGENKGYDKYKGESSYSGCQYTGGKSMGKYTEMYGGYGKVDQTGEIYRDVATFTSLIKAPVGFSAIYLSGGGAVDGLKIVGGTGVAVVFENSDASIKNSVIDLQPYTGQASGNLNAMYINSPDACADSCSMKASVDDNYIMIRNTPAEKFGIGIKALSDNKELNLFMNKNEIYFRTPKGSVYGVSMMKNGSEAKAGNLTMKDNKISCLGCTTTAPATSYGVKLGQQSPVGLTFNGNAMIKNNKFLLDKAHAAFGLRVDSAESLKPTVVLANNIFAGESAGDAAMVVVKNATLISSYNTIVPAGVYADSIWSDFAEITLVGNILGGDIGIDTVGGSDGTNFIKEIGYNLFLPNTCKIYYSETCYDVDADANNIIGKAIENIVGDAKLGADYKISAGDSDAIGKIPVGENCVKGFKDIDGDVRPAKDDAAGTTTNCDIGADEYIVPALQ